MWRGLPNPGRQGTVPPTSDAGLLTLSGYLRFWGWVYLAGTLLLAVLKREAAPSSNGGSSSGGGSSQRGAARQRPHAATHLVHSFPSPGSSVDMTGSAEVAPLPGAGPPQGGGGEGDALPLRESYLQLWWVRLGCPGLAVRTTLVVLVCTESRWLERFANPGV